MSLYHLKPESITAEDVIEIIEATEGRHRVVWTPGRILQEDGSEKQVMTSSGGKRRATLRRLRKILKTLADEGVLKRRGTQFNYGTIHELGYDYLPGDLRETTKAQPSTAENRSKRLHLNSTTHARGL
jgi:hypothetical protein